jgi:hypothetical protein
MNPNDCILFSGAAKGAEAAFGAAAQRYGIEEVNFTYEGHSDTRTRGIRVLTQAELMQGDVSLTYVSRLMSRTFPDTPRFRQILQCIWHQINNGQEVYIIGEIMDDNTVRGGTGWGAEFAKLCNKRLTVFDQKLDGWFQWTGTAWEGEAAPTINHVGITGGGTRVLKDNGLAAIDGLFDRSFS